MRGARRIGIAAAVSVTLCALLAPAAAIGQRCTPKLLGANRRGPATELVPAGELLYLVEGARLLVLDVSDPSAPVLLGRTELGARPVDLQRSGSLLATAAWFDGFLVIDVADPRRPAQRAHVRVSGFSSDVALAPGRLFLATGFSAGGGQLPDLRVYDLADPAHPVQIGAWSDDEDRWGADSLALVGPYLFVGTTEHLYVLDVSDPASPEAVASIWFHTYPGELVPSPDGRRLYFRASDGHEEGNSIGIVDITDPLQPVRLWSEYSDDGWGGVAGEGERLYATDSRDGLVVFDLADPSAPVRLAEAPMLRGANDLAAAGSRLFAAIGDDGVRVADVGDPLAPRIVGAYDARSPAIGLAVAGRFVYLRGSAGLRILDLAEPRSPFERSQLATFDGGYFGSDQLAYRDGKVFLPDAGGLRVIDVAHPARPVEIGTYATDRPAKAVAVRGTVVFVALAVPREADPDLLALDVSDPAHPQRIGGLDLSLWDVSRLAASGDLLLAGSYYGCRVLDVSSPAQPVEVGDCSPGHSIDDIVLQGARALLVGNYRLDILGLGDPAAPRLLGSLAFDGPAQSIAVRGEHAGIVGGWGYAHGFQIVDVSVPALPVTLGRARTPGYSRRVRAGPLGFYVADGESGLSVFRDCPFFADGFESGDMTRWSVVEGG